MQKNPEWKQSLCILPPKPPHPPKIYPISSPLVSLRAPPTPTRQSWNKLSHREEWREGGGGLLVLLLGGVLGVCECGLVGAGGESRGGGNGGLHSV